MNLVVTKVKLKVYLKFRSVLVGLPVLNSTLTTIFRLGKELFLSESSHNEKARLQKRD